MKPAVVCQSPVESVLLLISLLSLLAKGQCGSAASQPSQRTLLVGVLTEFEQIRLGQEVVEYHLVGLQANTQYELRVSYPATNPCKFDLQIAHNLQGGWMRGGAARKLLDVNKLVFSTDESGLLQGQPPVILLSATSAGVHRDGPSHLPSHVTYNIVLAELHLGIPRDSWPVAITAVSMVLMVVLMLPFWTRTVHRLRESSLCECRAGAGRATHVSPPLWHLDQTFAMWQILARACTLLVFVAPCLRVAGQGTLAYTAVVPNAGDLTTFLVNSISTSSVSPAAMTPNIDALSTNHAAYKANPTSASLHPVIKGIVDYMAHPDHLDQIRLLEKNQAYALVQQQMAVRRKQQCADLLNSQRKLGADSKLPQDAIDCVCDPYGQNLPYYVCNARYHTVLIPQVENYVANNTGPDSSGTSSTGRRRLLHDDTFNPEDLTRPDMHDERLMRKAGRQPNKAPVQFSCGTQFPIAEYPAFVKVSLNINLPGINFVPFTGTGSGQTQPFALEICETNGGGCTTFCPTGTPAAGGTCGSGKYIESKVVEVVAQSNINLDIAVCLGYTGSDPVTKQLYDTVSILLKFLGLDPCPIHGGVTIFPFILTADGYLQIGIAFVDIRADVEIKFAPDGGFTTQICDYLKTGYDVTPNPAYLQVQCRPFCYQKFGDGTFKVAAELKILWFAWSWTLFQTNFGSGYEPALCQHPPVGVYGPANGRNDTLYGPAIIAPGTELISANGNFLLRFGMDGNVALYDSQHPGTFPDVQSGDSILWQTSTSGTGSVVELMAGGDFQVRDSNGNVLFQTGTDSYVLGKPYMTVTNDGRVIVRDTYNNICYWDTANQCNDGIAYWPAGFSDSLVDTGNSTTPGYEPTCLSNDTMLVSKNRKYSLSGDQNYWWVQGWGFTPPNSIKSNNPMTTTRTVNCLGNAETFGKFCISSRPGDYPAYVQSDPNNPTRPTKEPVLVWSVSDKKNTDALAGPVHMTLGDDGELGMWDYNGKQIFSILPNQGQPDPNGFGVWIGLGQDQCAGITVGT
ncbi:hypothetical protein WJX72_002856 [[Myrmecia] bisecta]|uniref:Bulb-type lectin domain-containing protein n=1 Tax=[Myrmecia] bisecta TaxID=41462 RepID=A0AAW1PNH3_9CHLO